MGFPNGFAHNSDGLPRVNAVAANAPPLPIKNSRLEALTVSSRLECRSVRGDCIRLSSLRRRLSEPAGLPRSARSHFSEAGCQVLPSRTCCLLVLLRRSPFEPLHFQRLIEVSIAA